MGSSRLLLYSSLPLLAMNYSWQKPFFPSRHALPRSLASCASWRCSLKALCHEFFMVLNFLHPSPCEFQELQRSKSRFLHGFELRTPLAMNIQSPKAHKSRILAWFLPSHSFRHEKPLFKRNNKQDSCIISAFAHPSP